ncbi:uncharacterized protein LOC119995588 [Tripterygium wilfordii]|uniref:uncharacterized protein LOC119995588 n=1 Tax=Tripterygium wilfordii TaxID=458696 RepID=UPI0018F80D8F|nr:uncharacterized protein LOC119995588 [Tripterygium wilfordii]
MNLDHLRSWVEDLQLSNGSSDGQDDIFIKQEDEHVEESEDNIDVDFINEFFTNMVFKSRQSLIDWVQDTGRNLGFIIVIKRSEIGGFGKRPKLQLHCDRGGTYKNKTLSTKFTGTKKIDCPFRLKGVKLKTDDDWMLRVLCGKHNHAATLFMEGHPYVGRLSAVENEILVDMSKNFVKPRNILNSLKNHDPYNASIIDTIYNARKKIRAAEKADRSEMQILMSFLHESGYIFYHRTNALTNELEDLFFAYPGSLELLRAFPHVLLMDATYKTNRFRMPLLEIVGVTSTNMTYCIAFVYLNSEKEENYTWALRCLRSTMEECTAPRVIVTDRELALMNSCAVVILQNHPTAVNYIETIWLTPYKEMFVTAWTDSYLHFGNQITNRVESQHAKLKRYLGSTQSNLKSSVLFIHELIRNQISSIKASLEKSRNIIQHRFRTQHFQELWSFVSIYTLDLILTEFERYRKCYGLPCAHEIAIHVNDGRPIPLASIDAFWRKLDLSPCVSLLNDDIDCAIEVQIFTEQFKKQSRPGKFSLLRKLREIIKPSTTSVQEPAVKTNTRGRPPTKNRVVNTKQTTVIHDQEPNRHSYSYDRPISKQKAVIQDKEPSRHSYRYECPISNLKSGTSIQGNLSAQMSSRSERINYSVDGYVRQFSPILQDYIKQVEDVIPDGNCSFRAIAVCLRLGKDAWATILYNLMEELNTFWDQYVAIFGSEERAYHIQNSLNFFATDRGAPIEHWMTMPDKGLLIASRYNVILHVLNQLQSLTYLPLRSTPPPLYQHVAIAIGHVNNNHYVRVALTEGYPMPPIMYQWKHFRYDCAATWATSYMEQLDAYIQHTRSRFPPETIVLED